MRNRQILALTCFGLVLAGAENIRAESINDVELRNLAKYYGTGVSQQPRTEPIPPPTAPKAELGKKLFFSKDLGGDKDTACVSCHHPLLGGGDHLSLPIGSQATIPDLLGPGRTHSATRARAAGMLYDGGPTVPRVAPTTFNAALWQQVMFLDGRVEALPDGGVRTPDTPFGVADPQAPNLIHGQALFPVTSPEEMASSAFEGKSNDEIRDALAQRVSANPQWQVEFDRVYGDEAVITFSRIAESIAQYEASQWLTDSPWQAFMEGDNHAINRQEKAGATLFFQEVKQGGAGCAACHNGENFSDEAFHALAMPQIGRGKDDGVTGSDDFGRMRETGKIKDKYSFRTPQLLNVSATYPYSHAGGYETLEDVVRHHLNVEEAVNNYDFTLTNLSQPGLQNTNAEANTRKALSVVKRRQENGNTPLKNVDLSNKQVKQLVAFLHTLTDPCVEKPKCLAQWVAEPDAGLNILEAQFAAPQSRNTVQH
ncbi:Cytochrome c551 peroxidase [BD1-7 clade bacterium]|uniref:Cytochrome c551 peroxidase n=1 Tax=BD1-7 clade bacterium TaxID=2029982 RepID=A0A5S9QDY1_9GAMM|nr:Cytochrome c551 peroxidase [BD1-7 clade bacterium]CAA0116537.1 Cytochrome c551 peroxidase [BD1-7 clade bacterium]